MTRRSLLSAVLILAGCRSTAATAPKHAIAWQPPVEIAEGGGTKGPWRQNDSHFDYVDDPSVALAADGSAAVVWVDHRDKDVHFQVFAPDGTPRLPEPVNVSRTPDVFSWLPRIVVSGRDVFVLWQEIVFSGGSHGGEMFFARSSDGGATFGEPINLSRSIGGDGKGRFTKERWQNGSFDLALAPDGTLYAVWTEFYGQLWFASSTDGGASFSKPEQVAGSDELPARAPSLAVAADGTVYLAWTYGETDAADIQLAVRRDGKFDTPRAIATTPTYSDAPKLAIDREGTLHVAFAETDGGPFDRSRVEYTRSRDGGKTFEPARTVSRGDAGAAFPDLALDGDHVLVVWEVVTGNERVMKGLGLAISSDRGTELDALELVPNSRDPGGGWNGSHQGHLMEKLAAQGGELAIVNSSLAHGKGSRVWLMRGRLGER